MKRSVLAGIMLVVLSSALGRAQTTRAEAGVTFLRQEQYARALEEFKQARTEHPNDASIENLLGITETKLGRMDEANADYQSAIALNPNLASPRKNLAVNFLTVHQYAEAEEQLNAALKLSSSDPFLHYYLASLYVATSRDESAVDQLDSAESLIIRDPALLFSMAVACLHVHADAKAMTLIGDAEKGGLVSVGQEYELALLLTSKRMYSEAVDRFKQIAKAQPDAWVPRFDLAIALLNANEPGQAEPILERLLQDRPQDANLQAALGSAYELSGDTEKAIGAYRKAVAGAPDNPDWRLDYTRLLMDMDRYDEAVSIVQTGIEHSSDPYALDIRKGSIQTLQGQYAEARRSFQAAMDAHPEISLGYFALAQSYMREGNDRQALAVLTTARLKSQPDAKLDYLDGIVLAHLGKRDEAILALRASITLDAGVADSHYELGKLLLEAGDVQPAKEEFERAIALAPDHSNAYYQLSRVYGRLGDPAKSAQMARKTQELLAKARANALEDQRAKQAGFQEVRQ